MLDLSQLFPCIKGQKTNFLQVYLCHLFTTQMFKWFYLQPAYSDRPKIVEYGAYTQASPTKEKGHYRHTR